MGDRCYVRVITKPEDFEAARVLLEEQFGQADEEDPEEGSFFHSELNYGGSSGFEELQKDPRAVPMIIIAGAGGCYGPCIALLDPERKATHYMDASHEGTPIVTISLITGKTDLREELNCRKLSLRLKYYFGEEFIMKIFK